MLLVVDVQSQSAEVARSIEKLLPKPDVGGCVLVIHDGVTVFKQGFGVARLDTRERCTPATNFRMGSVSKQFTATAVMLSVDQGKLTTETPLSTIFHEPPPFWRKTTVRHLLTHTSGIQDYFVPEGLTFQLSDQDVLAQQLDFDRAIFPPGQQWEYCNAGYVLLGLAVEQVNGVPFHHFVSEQIFAPLGMDNSRIYYRGRNTIPNRALGHVKREGEWILGDQSPTSALRGDGSLYSSLNDMEKWIHAVFEGKLLTKASTQQMFTPFDGLSSGYGYGWFIDAYQGRQRVSHGGATRGFRTYLQLFPASRSAVLIQVNSESGGLEMLAERIADRVLPSRV